MQTNAGDLVKVKAGNHGGASGVERSLCRIVEIGSILSAFPDFSLFFFLAEANCNYEIPFHGADRPFGHGCRRR